MSKKITAFLVPADSALIDTKLWVIGDPTSGDLYKPTLLQMKKYLWGTLSPNGIITSDGSKLTQDAANFSWNASTKQMQVNGSITVGNTGSLVKIETPVNLGWSRSIDIDQPNMQIVFKNGNADAGSSISRPTHNGGNFEINASRGVDGSNNPTPAFLILKANSIEKAKVDENGLQGAILTKAGDPVVGDIAAGTFRVCKNSTSGVVSLWVNDGGTLKTVALA